MIAELLLLLAILGLAAGAGLPMRWQWAARGVTDLTVSGVACHGVGAVALALFGALTGRPWFVALGTLLACGWSALYGVKLRDRYQTTRKRMPVPKHLR